MKPTLFIGSSLEGKSVAAAIAGHMQYKTYPKPWVGDVFTLSNGTVESLMLVAQESDYGIFVFTPDDTAKIRGREQTAPRDNVVYELGLFSGVLGPSRCFFLVPIGVDIRLPTDLHGITPGEYDASRPDKDWKSAVAAFCNEVEVKIEKLGVRKILPAAEVARLSIEYECCDWIQNGDDRWRKKNSFFDSMLARFRLLPPKKRVVRNQNSLGFFVALAAAIVANPEKDDAEILLSIEPSRINPGNPQYKMLDAVQALYNASQLTRDLKSSLLEWASKFPDADAKVKDRLAKFAR